jgi:hypothetical protein
MSYYVSPAYSTYQTREIDPEDSWDAGEYDGFVTGIQIHEWKDYNGSDAVTKFPSYAVVVGYETGNTFGRDFTATVVGVLDSDEEAQALAGFIDEQYGSYESRNGGDYSFRFEFGGKEYYAPWEGYFERFSSVHVYEVTDPNGKKRY